MDRSYPYSRRLTSRARLRKRMLAVAVAGLAGATSLFMLTWEADPISAAVAPQAQPLLALAGAAGDAPSRGVRRIYPYSIIPGGVSGPAELARVIRTDSVVATHYASFDVAQARAVTVAKPRAVHVSYRKGGKVYWTARKVMLAEGETLLTDGRNEMRARCANRISDVAQYPVEAHQPTMEELDNPAEVDEGEQYALGADGLPVSIDPAIDPRQTGRSVVIYGGNGFLGAPGVSAPAATPLAGTTFASSTASGIPVTTMAYSGSSSSVGTRPRPSDDAPLTQPPASTGSDGGSSSSGSPAPSPGSGTDTPAGTPVPDTGTPPPSGQPTQEPAPLPLPEPTPLPGPESPPVFTPDPVPQPGGGTDPLPPTTPTGPGPLFPQPGIEPEPFIPKPELAPPPLDTSTDTPAKPADVPEPDSFWLAAIGLAALGLLRRRPRSLKRES